MKTKDRCKNKYACSDAATGSAMPCYTFYDCNKCSHWLPKEDPSIKPFCSDLEMYAMDIVDDKPCDECNSQSEDPRCPHQDSCTGLNKLALKSYAISKARGQDPDNVFKHMAGEVLEAQEAKQRYLAQIWEPKPAKLLQAEMEYADELADVIICALSAAARSSLDIEAAIIRKIHINAQRAADGK